MGGIEASLLYEMKGLSNDKNMAAMTMARGRWAGRFIWASIIQGLLAVLWTLFIINPYLTYGPSKVIAGGGAGTWFFVGYVSYVLVGVVGVAVTAIFYFYIESVLGKAYSGLTSYLAWAHIILMNVGVAGACFLLMWGGYHAGVAQASVSSGGGGLTTGQIHVQILSQLVNPTGYFIVMAAGGAILGGLGYLLAQRKK
jgi:heme/copper-type cytochrome/quinol oxidase subunit 1